MKNCDKNFSDNVQWSSKHLQKKTCAEIQSDVKQQQIKKTGTVSYNFLQKYLPSQKLK